VAKKADLFGHQENQLTLDLKKDRDYSNLQGLNNREIVSKLKKLSKSFESMKQNRLKPLHFHQILTTGKFSKFHKKLRGKN
jgi:hypothetical protein